MRFAVVGPALWLEPMQEQIRRCNPAAEPTVEQYGYEQIRQDPPARQPDAAFVLVDSMDALYAARALRDWCPQLPIAFVSESPDYAMEAIRLGVWHYLILPLQTQDMCEALNRLAEH